MNIYTVPIGTVLLCVTTSYSNNHAENYLEDLVIKRDYFVPTEEATTEYENEILKTKPIIIPIGSNCFQGITLRRLGLRFLAYPFDWNVTGLSAIYQLVENDFIGLCDKRLFIRSDRMGHARYNILFRHDFHTGPAYNDAAYDRDLEQAVERYKRRIARFYKAINSGKPICFIRATSCAAFPYFPNDMQITKSWAASFVALLKRKFPKLVFTLVCSDYTEEIKSDWHIPNCVNFYYDLSKWPPDFARAEADWREKMAWLGFGN